VAFEEVIIDLDTPRTAEYLAVNPRGLVPSLSFNGDIIIESAIVSDFLASQYPSHLLPARSDPDYALKRARIDLFVDAYITKFQQSLFKLFGAKTAEEQAPIIEAAVASLVKEVEPRLADAAPFFGGSDKQLTQADVSDLPREGKG
jgi:glutathione S-transferase